MAALDGLAFFCMVISVFGTVFLV